VTRIFWDTHVFLYLFEGGRRGEEAKRVRERMLARRDALFTSSLTIGEILTRTSGVGPEEAAAYRSAVSSAATVLPFDESAAVHYARLRANASLTALDAIQLACAAAGSIDMFITNDDRYSSLVVPGIKFITPLSRAFL
jgi:predicted nucleic acid-binding protein